MLGHKWLENLRIDAAERVEHFLPDVDGNCGESASGLSEKPVKMLRGVAHCSR